MFKTLLARDIKTSAVRLHVLHPIFKLESLVSELVTVLASCFELNVNGYHVVQASRTAAAAGCVLMQMLIYFVTDVSTGTTEFGHDQICP